MNQVIHSDKQSGSLFALFHHRGGVGYNLLLLKCSFDTNSWIKYNIYGIIPSIYHPQRNTAVFDSKHERIYFHAPSRVGDRKHSLTIFQIIGEYEYKINTIYANSRIDTRPFLNMIMINDQVHLIGGDNDKHFKYDPQENCFEIAHNLYDMMGTEELFGHGLIKIKNKLLMFGGDQSHEYGKALNTIGYNL